MGGSEHTFVVLEGKNSQGQGVLMRKKLKQALPKEYGGKNDHYREA
jgi:hypothetical protein